MVSGLCDGAAGLSDVSPVCCCDDCGGCVCCCRCCSCCAGGGSLTAEVLIADGASPPLFGGDGLGCKGLLLMN